MPVRGEDGDTSHAAVPAGSAAGSGQPLEAPDPAAFTHQALLYRSVDELVELVGPFLCDGARAGDVTVMVATLDKLAAVRDALDTDDARHVAFWDSHDVYADVGPSLTGFQQRVQQHTAAGRRVRCVAEPPLGSASRPQWQELCHNDAAANEVAARPGVTAVCPVDVPATPAEAVAAIRRCHPEVVEAGACHPSPDYTDPATLLAAERRKPLPSPPGDVIEMPGPADATSARAFVDQHLTGVLAQERRNDFVIAVNEVVINACTHAAIDYLRLWHEDDRVVCEVGDVGSGLADPLAGYRQPDVWQTSGWGLWLARQMAHVVEVSTGDEGSRVRLHAIVSPAADAAPR